MAGSEGLVNGAKNAWCESPPKDIDNTCLKFKKQVEKVVLCGVEVCTISVNFFSEFLYVRR